MRRLIVIAAVLMLTLFSGAFGSTANANTLVVDSSGDQLHQVCVPGSCTLRDAIYLANFSPSFGGPVYDRIEFSADFDSPQTINLGSTLSIEAATATLTVFGRSGVNIVAVASDAFGVDRRTTTLQNLKISSPFTAISVSNNQIRTLSLQNVTLTGTLRGLLLSAGSSVSVSGSTISGSGGSSVNGGGISVTQATLNINSTTISNNTGFNGGGIYAEQGSVVTVFSCTISNNSAVDGGGLHIRNSQIFLNDNVILSNTATLGGGFFGHAISGASTIIGNSIKSNAATNGGGLYFESSGTQTIQNSDISSNSARYGGGIYLDDTTNGKLLSSTLSANTASNGAGAYAAVAALLTLSSSTVANNQSNNSQGDARIGGGIYTQSLLNLINSTVSGNSAAGINGGMSAGGIFIDNGAPNGKIVNSTITNNSATGSNAVGGLGLRGNNTSMPVYNTILAANQTLPDVSPGMLVNQSNNFINGNPGLLPLANYGGPTSTHAFPCSSNSPAIDAGNSSLALDENGQPLTLDQRGDGFPRIFGGTVDLGAVESSSTAVTNNSDDVNTVGSLRWAINTAPGGAICFDPVYFSVPRTISMTAGEILINKSLQINGPGSSLLTLDANNLSRHIFVSTATVSLSGMTLIHGHTNATDPQQGSGGSIYVNPGVTFSGSNLSITGGSAGESFGGCIFSNNATFRLTDSTVANCLAPDGTGGGLFNQTGAMTLTRVTVSGSTAIQGGGIFNSGQLNIDSSTITGNTATRPAGQGSGPLGGGISNAGNLSFANSTLSNNSAQFGGGIYNVPNTGTNGYVDIHNSTVSGNTAVNSGNGATADGGGIYADGNYAGGLTATIDVHSITMSGNTAVNSGGGLFMHQVSGSFAVSNLHNSIIAGNSAGAGPDISGQVIGYGYDLIGNTSGSSFAGNSPSFTGNILNPAGGARLAPIDNYGGPTKTFALLPNSPAIDAGDPSFFYSPDQRGSLRPVGANPDIGSFEQNIILANPPDGRYGIPYSQPLLGTSLPGPSPLVTFSIFPVAGQGLPPGLSLATNGTLSGTPTTLGSYTFTVKAATADGLADIAQVTMNILPAWPTIQKSFDAATIPLFGATVLTFTISNPNPATDLTGVAFTDLLPSATGKLIINNNPNVNSDCGGTVTASPGGSSITLSGSTVTHNSTCTISVLLTGTAAGDANNTTSAITSNESGTGATSNTALVKIVNPPTIQKAFGASTIPLNGTTTLIFTLTNPSVNTTSADGIGFSDSLQHGLEVAATPGVTNSCGGTVTANAGAGSISFSGGSIATPGSQCTITVNVTGTQLGNAPNQAGPIISDNGGVGSSSNNVTLKVLTPPTIQKTFGATNIPLNGTTTLTFTITNPATNTASVDGIAFSDTLQNGLVVGTPNGLSNSCGGTATVVAGSTSISLSGGSVATPGNTCTIAVNVNGTQSGDVTNTTGAVSSTNAGTGQTSNTATLKVLTPPTIHKVFGATSIPLNGTTALTFTITNPAANNTSASGIAFSDTLQNGLKVATPNGVSNTCGGSVTAVAGSTSISLSGGSIANSGDTCTLAVNVNGTQTGNVSNTTGAVSSTNAGTGAASNTATMNVVGAPTIQKAFGAATIPLNGTTTLSFTITNPAANPTSADGIAFSDTLQSGLQVASPNGLSNACGGSVTATAGSSSISLSGGSIATPGATCTVTVSVTGTQSGNVPNTTSAVSSTNGGTGAVSNTANLIITSPPTIRKAFSASTIPFNGTTTLTFTITNPNSATDFTGVAFSDMLPTTPGTIVVGSTPNVNNGCGGTVTANAGGGSISLASGSLTHNGQCTLKVDVKGTVAGNVSNITGAVSSTEGGTGTASNIATLAVEAAVPPTIQKAFSASTIPLNGTTTLTFTITNSNTATDLTGVAFSDTLPSTVGTIVVAPTPNVINGCGGTVTANAGAGSISLANGNVTHNGLCTLKVDVKGTVTGDLSNITGAVSSTEGGTGTTSNAATLKVVAPPTIQKAFSDTSIALNATTTVSFTITNPAVNTTALNGIAFSDSLQNGLKVAASPGVTNNCNGSVTATPGSTSISLSGGSISTSGNQCTITVKVTPTQSGNITNTTGAVSSTNGGTGVASNTANLTVIAPPTIEKAFGASSVAFNGTASLTFTIQNSNAISLTGVSFTDTFPAGLQVAAPPNVSNGCGGTFSPSPGDVSLTFSGGTVPPGSFCTVSVDVKGTTTGTKNNTTAAISSTEGGTGTTSNTAQLSVGCLSSTVVTNNNDSGASSLRDALANIGVSICVGGTITFDPALSGQTINLTSDQLIINQSVTITGPGSNLLTIRRGNAAPDFRIMKIASGVVNISGLTISNGSESNGEGGGGIRNDGTLTLTDCAISANVSKVIDDGFGDLSPGIGGGIRNNGSLTITNSIISGNTAASAPDTGTGGANGLGGGIYNVSPNTVTIQDSTVSGNTATLGGGFMDDFGTMNITRCAIVSNGADVGGGIYTGGTMTVKDTTISGNTIGPGFSGLSSASGVFNAGGQATFVNVTVTANGPNGGIENRGLFKILNTIVAGNNGGDATSVSTSFGGPFTSLGHNLIGDGTGSTGFNSSDQVGTSGAPIDPRLAPLGNYGGPTKTHALLFNSPAIEAGDDCVFTNSCSGVNLGSPVTMDQRGFSRKIDDNMVPGNHVDIGAVEREEPEVRSMSTGSNVNNYFADLTITFPTVTVAGSTSVTDITQGTLPNGYSSCSGCPSFDISTTASFTGPVNLCFYLPSVSAGDFPSLRVLHDTGNGLADNGTSQIFPATHLVCAKTNSFSPFTIGKGSSPTAANGSISGKITETSGAPIAGVTINLGGSQSSETITDANGNYSFEAVETNGFYTVTPARANYTFNPASRSFSLLGVHTEASFTANANGDHENAIDTIEFFVRQQYLDFLGREPDPPGFNGWVNTLRNCAPEDANCDRIHVSESFYRSPEFQERGYFVFRFYSTAFGRKPDYAEFTPDLQRVSGFLTNDQLEAAKAKFADDFMARPQFSAQYGSLNNSAYVDALINTAAVNLSNRQALIDGLNSGTLTRAQALRQIAESAELYQKYYNQAFVVMEYFGYLRRDPDALYPNWISVLDANPADSRHMVEGFVDSTEYRNRFGP